MTATAVSSVVADGPAAGCRALDLRVKGGIDVRILPDRGFDVGAAWFRGVPLAWISAVGETAPLPQPRGGDWNDAFGGGLVTTCGLRNVGVPSEGHGQHGTFSHLRAREVRVDREEAGLVAAARVVDASALGHRLELTREIRTAFGEGRVTIVDVTRNLGPETEAAPILYHVNLLWDSVDIDSREVVPRDEDAAAGLDTWRHAPVLEPGAPERVFEHLGASRAIVAQGDVRLTLTWTLPRLWQWVHPGHGVLGVEPANCSVLGRAHDRSEGRLPVLEPGEERTTSIEITAEVK
ncbi:MAG: DUF4432 family protein [Gaiellaceae bacterium]